MALFGKKKQTVRKVADERAHLPELYNGMIVEVMGSGLDRMFPAVLTLLSEGRVQLVDREGGRLVPAEFNSKVQLRCSLKDGSPFTFTGYVCGSSDTFWRLERLEAIQTGENRRNSFRQAISVDGMVMRVGREAEEAGAATPVACTLMDISAGGTFFRCETEFEQEDCLYLMGFKLLPNEPEFGFTCRVKRKIPKGKVFDYGCQFEGLSDKEEDRLLQAIFQMQRKSLQHRRPT